MVAWSSSGCLRGLVTLILALSAAPASAEERNRVLPDVPTLNETVMPGFDILAWAGMFGPANLPPEIVRVLADAVQKALSTPLVIERLNAGGTEVFWSGPQDFSEFVKTELVKWAAAIKEAGIEPE